MCNVQFLIKKNEKIKANINVRFIQITDIRYNNIILPLLNDNKSTL